MSKGRVFRSKLSAAPALPKGRIYRSKLSGAAGAASKGRIYQAKTSGTAAVVVVPMANRIGGPGEVLTFAAALIGGGAADSWTFRRIAGPAITFSGTGATRTVVVPSVMPPAPGNPVPTFQVGISATVGATTSAEVVVTVQVIPQLSWSYNGTTLVGSRVVPA